MDIWPAVSFAYHNHENNSWANLLTRLKQNKHELNSTVNLCIICNRTL